MQRFSLQLSTLLIPLLGCAATAHASDVAVGAKLGTLGVGLEGAVALTDDVQLRAGFNTFSHTFDSTKRGVTYSADLKLNTIGAIADWFPTANGFRLSAGLFADNNQVDITGRPARGTYTINGTVYQASDVASFAGQVRFAHVAPYLGLGWGRTAGAHGNVIFSADAGVMFQGRPKVTLNATCGAALPAAQCAQLQRDTANERSQVSDDARPYRFYPVLAIGVSYAF